MDDDDLSAACLPDDLIADVLRRLAPRCLAASRCVCKQWKTVVDTRRLLRADLLPLSLHGIFIDFGWRLISEFFSRPSSEISGRIDFLPLPSERPEYHITFVVRGHCNGLLLIGNDYAVVNPATQRWDSLPPLPPDRHYKDFVTGFMEHLVFDPIVSPHYEVIMFPVLPFRSQLGVYLDLKAECPPSPLVLRVFSSRSGRWEERSFDRQGSAAGTVLQFFAIPMRLCSVYWRGSLYVHCHRFLIRISLSEDKYNVIAPPAALREDGRLSLYNSHLGRSQKGVYLATFLHDVLHVWVLDGAQLDEWVLKGKYSSQPLKAFNRQVYGPWILQDSCYEMYGDNLRPSTNKEPECKFEWNSDDDHDDDDTMKNGKELVDRASSNAMVTILGFHPYKEIIFFSRFEDRERIATGLAYHLNSSKVEALGSIYPTHGDPFEDMYPRNWHRAIRSSFTYTPCWIGDLGTLEE